MLHIKDYDYNGRRLFGVHGGSLAAILIEQD